MINPDHPGIVRSGPVAGKENASPVRCPSEDFVFCLVFHKGDFVFSIDWAEKDVGVLRLLALRPLENDISGVGREGRPADALQSL